MAECLVTAGWGCPTCAEKFQTAGIEKDEVWVGNHSEITAYGSIVDGEINALTFAQYKGLFKLCFHKDTAQITEELVAGTNAGYHYTQTFEGRVIDDSTVTRNAIEDMVGVDVVIIAKKKNGKYKLIGENGGVSLEGNVNNTGAATGDDVGDLLTWTGIGLGRARYFLDIDEATTKTTLDSYVL